MCTNGGTQGTADMHDEISAIGIEYSNHTTTVKRESSLLTGPD